MTPSMTRFASVLAFAVAATGCTPGISDLDPGGGGKGDNGGDVTADANCPGVNFTATSTTPSIQLLIDRSGSMSTPLPNSNLTAYQAMREALVGSTGVVMQLQGKAHFGASLYSSDNPCPRLYSTATRGVNNFAQIQQLIDSQGPNGNTPTPEAIDQTVALFAANPAPMGSPPIIVLATDGLPNSCLGGDTQTESIQAAATAHAKGIRTFVLGIAGVNDGFLQSMANAGQGVQTGQTPAKYFTANSPQELQQAFQQIIGGVVSCELAISGTVNPELAKAGVVTVNGQQLTYGQDWEVVNGTTIRLLGQACENLKSGTTAQAMVQASFPCGAVIL